MFIKKKAIKIIILFTIVPIIIIGISFFLLFGQSLVVSKPAEQSEPETAVQPQTKKIENISNHPACLQEGETAEWEADDDADVTNVKIIIKDKNGVKQSSFNIEMSNPKRRDSLELRSCGIYAIRKFNYDHRKTKQNPGYKEEIWKYKYDGSGEKKILLHIKDENNKYISHYSPEFRISPDEKYIGLVRGYFGSPNHALVIKNMETLQDDIVLNFSDMEKQIPDARGSSMGLKGWSVNSRYLWAKAQYGANVTAYVRIDAQTGENKIFSTPAGSMGGDALNPDLGLVTAGDRLPWTGDADMDIQNAEERQKEGKKNNIRVYDLLAGEEIAVVYESNDPYWWGEPRWISKSELQYKLPDETEKIWTVPEKYLKRAK